MCRAGVQAAIDFIKTHPWRPGRHRAIGYCFGGQDGPRGRPHGCAASSVVSFHGGVGYDFSRQKKPSNVPCWELHGNADASRDSGQGRGLPITRCSRQTPHTRSSDTRCGAWFTEVRDAAYNERADRKSWA